VDRTIWSKEDAIDPVTLADADLPRYRHPAERTSIAVIVFLVGVISLALMLMGPAEREALGKQLHWAPRGLVGLVLEVLHPTRFLGTVLVFLLVVAVVEGVTQWVARGRLLSTAIEITDATYPRHFAVVKELSARFNLPPTRVFVERRSSHVPESFGFHAPFVVVFPTAVFTTLSIDDFTFLLGHEFGHIKLGHTYLTAFVGNGHMSVAGHDILRRFRNAMFASVQRAEELSADRIGVLATRSVDAGINRIIRSALALPSSSKIDLDDLTPQAVEVSHPPMSIAALCGQALSGTPVLLMRLRALTLWAGLPAEAPAPDAASNEAPAAGSQPS
jgi:Zn-dependent protease with chaperone function